MFPLKIEKLPTLGPVGGVEKKLNFVDVPIPSISVTALLVPLLLIRIPCVPVALVISKLYVDKLTLF